MPHRVSVRVLPGCRGHLTAAELRRVARRVLVAEDVAPSVEVEVVLAGAATVQDLNRLYRGKDEPTDVLSFAEHESASDDSPSLWTERGSGGEVVSPSLGEVVVCLPIAESQALSANRDVRAEVAHLVVHGLLHLLGYDHELSAAESKRMRAREDAALIALGYEGQYAHGH
ncbi:MAG TPA: rRNA maturation RNase YbeY [Dehalococcoidia bacterium]|nr:rRNA maturation RNase YbeY [Dehalococcoidia bacterium]